MYLHSAEVDYILNVLLPLLVTQLGIPASKIGIITPYRYQVVIRHSLHATNRQCITKKVQNSEKTVVEQLIRCESFNSGWFSRQ